MTWWGENKVRELPGGDHATVDNNTVGWVSKEKRLVDSSLESSLSGRWYSSMVLCFLFIFLLSKLWSIKQMVRESRLESRTVMSVLPKWFRQFISGMMHRWGVGIQVVMGQVLIFSIESGSTGNIFLCYDTFALSWISCAQHYTAIIRVGKKTPSIYMVEKKIPLSWAKNKKKPSRRRRPRRPKAGEKKT